MRSLAVVLFVVWAASVGPTLATQPVEMTFALTGDSIITRKLAVYDEPAFMRVINLIRGADVAFTNLEMLFHDYEPYAMSASGGTYMRAEPALVKDLVWAGFDLVARANNHTGDYGVLGMNLTTKYVADAGLVQAGVGQSLA
jgi:poly-gamma-glutamate synthesis protein (capsule biosynthesis protein)